MQLKWKGTGFFLQGKRHEKKAPKTFQFINTIFAFLIATRKSLLYV